MLLKLIVDIGNTSSKIAVFSNDEIIDFRVINDKLIEVVKEVIVSFPDICSSILSSVSNHDGQVSNLLQEKGYFIELNHTTNVPFKNMYQSTTTLGKDRIAIAAAGIAAYPDENVLVIDMGTCVTYDFINADGEYLGGAISPGLTMRFDSLGKFTHGLPTLDKPSADEEVNLIGKTTHESITSGVINGLKMEVEHIINQYEALFSPLKIIISGGDYLYFENLAKSNIFASPNIVVYGLKKILDFNEKN